MGNPTGLKLLFRRLFPRIPHEYLPTPGELEKTTHRHRDFTSAYGSRLAWLQSGGATTYQAANLSFMPIPKNVRSLATKLYRAEMRGHALQLSSGNEREENALKEIGLDPWGPWLWSRIPAGQLDAVGTGQDDATRAWPTYFLPLDAANEAAPKYSPKQIRLVAEPRYREKLLSVAECTRFVFRLNPRMQQVIGAYSKAAGWQVGIPAVGIHLRRGDAASENLDRQTRPSYSLEKYLDAADRMCARYGYRTIYLSTESEAEIERASKLMPQYKFISLVHNREIFPRILETSEFIEHRALRHVEYVEPIANSTIADLYFLSQCRAFVGTFNSEFSMLALMLCIGTNGSLVPYLNMVRPKDMALIDGRIEYR